MFRRIVLAVSTLALGVAPAARAELLTKVASLSELALLEGLTGVEHVVMSPDDQIVCVTATGDQSIACHRRDATSGQLVHGDVEKDGVGGVDGIETPGEPGFDSSGRHLYVPGEGEDALAVFAVADDGALTWVETQREGFAGVAGLDAPAVARVSPDGAFVYAAGTSAITIFERDPVTGGLDWVAQQLLPSFNEDTLAMELSPDGATLYLATDEDTLHAFTRSATTGLLTVVDTEAPGEDGLVNEFSVRTLVLGRNGRQLYAQGLGRITVFDRAPSGTLTVLQQQPALTGPGLALAGDGRGLWVSYGNLGGIFTYQQIYYPIDAATGAVGASQNGIFLSKNMGGGRIAASRDWRHLYLADSVNDDPSDAGDGFPVIDVLSVKPLAFVEKQGDGVAGVDGLDGARGAAVSPDGRHVYVPGVDDDAVAVFARDATTGALDFVEVERDGVNGVDGLDGATDVTISPDGKHVYVCGFVDDAVAVFSRDATTGALTFVEQHKDGVDGDYLNYAFASAMSPDGSTLYVVAYSDDAINIFSRDPGTGALALVAVRRDGIAGVTGLNGAADVAVSPDGQNVYVASYDGDSVVVFAVTDGGNPLAFVTSYTDAAPSDRLDAADGIAVSPDGRNVYVVAFNDDAINVFDRHPDGTLAVQQALTDTTGEIDGLDAARGVSIAPDGRHVYVAGELSDAIAVFRRDPATGALGFAQVEIDSPYAGTNPDGLDQARAAVPSPDGRHVYVAAGIDDTVTIFAPEPGALAAGAIACGAVLAIGRRRRAPRRGA